MTIKPDLRMYFVCMPLVGPILEAEYNEAKNLEEIIELFHTWRDYANNTSDEVEKQWLISASNYIYSYFTNRSFDTKKFETL